MSTDKFKKQCQGLHAIKRAKQRFDIRLTPGILEGMVEQIQTRTEVEFVRWSDQGEDMSRSIWIFKMPFACRAVYDHETEQIVTVLPLKYSDERFLDD